MELCVVHDYRVTSADTTTNEWHYYISSCNLSAEGLLKHARYEWSVETMHWLLAAGIAVTLVYYRNVE